MKSNLNFFLIIVLFLISCSKSKDEASKQEIQNKQESKTKMELKLTSSSFENNNFIPAKYTCDGEDISPALSWNNISDSVKSYAIIVDDPDAPGGDWVHWVIYNIPGNVTNLSEGFSSSKSSVSSHTQGLNDFKKLYYRGPCPPSGVHRYFFKLFALDDNLNLKAGLSKKELLESIEKHIIAKSELIGKYQK